MTVQYIIVGFIIASAVLGAIYRFVRSIKKPVGKCEGCSAITSGCALHELKQRKA